MSNLPETPECTNNTPLVEVLIQAVEPDELRRLMILTRGANERYNEPFGICRFQIYLYDQCGGKHYKFCEPVAFRAGCEILGTVSAQYVKIRASPVRTKVSTPLTLQKEKSRKR